MRKKIFLDANILLYSQDSKSRHFKQATNIIKAAIEKEDKMLVSPYVLNEVHFFLVKQVGKSAAYKTIRDILKYPNLKFMDIELTIKDMESVLRLANKYNLKTFDAFHTFYCKKLKIKNIASFDKDFNKIPWLKVIN